MRKSIHVNSIELLIGLDAALGQFAEKSLITLENAGNEVKHKLKWINDRCEQLEREFNYWSSEYDSADREEDDMNYLANKRDEASEKVHRAKQIRQRVEESCENFIRQASRINEISTSHLSENRAFLRQKIKELHDYANFQIAENGGAFADVLEDSGQSQKIESSSSTADEVEIEKRIDDAESEWRNFADGRVRTKFGLDFGQFAHERFEKEIRQKEAGLGRVENVHYGVEFVVEHNGKKVRYDYVDLENHLIIDYKSAKMGQTEETVSKNNWEQRSRHIEAYKAKFGIDPTYQYITYPSSVDMYPKED